MKPFNKGLAIGLFISMPFVTLAEDVEQIGDTGWYQFVFGDDIGAAITAGGDAPPLQGFDLVKRRHGYSAKAGANITMGCQGVSYDSVFQAQVSSHLTGLFQVLDDPMGVVVAAGSYFMGNAYSVGAEVMAQFEETFTWLTESCEAAGQKLAEVTADNIPELAKYKCRDTNGGQESECVGDRLNQEIQDFVSQYHDDAIMSIQSALADKVMNSNYMGSQDRTAEDLYIKQNMDFFSCPSYGSTNASYMTAVYANTSMECAEYIELVRLIGDITVVDNASGLYSNSGSYTSTRSMAAIISLQELFTEYSMAYGETLYQAVRSDNPMGTRQFERLTVSPGAGAISRAQLASLAQMERAGEELMLAGRIRRLADLWAMNHIREMLIASEANFAEYDSRPNKPVDISDNVLLTRLDGNVAELSVLSEFVEMRELERKAWLGE